MGITPSPNMLLRERVYKIQYVLESRAEELATEDLWNYESIHKAAERLLNFEAIYDGYIAADPTQERFMDTLTRLEREVFSINYPLPKGDRKVVIRLGEPVNLKEHFQSYKQNKVSTIEMLTHKIQQTVQSNLDILIS